MAPDELKGFRERRERLLKRDEPFVRPFELAKDAWVLWAAYDLGSFPAIKKGLSRDEFFGVLRNYAAGKTALLMIEENHKYFREKRGPVALVAIENYGWRVEPHFDYFFWATPRHRLSAVVSFLQMVRYSKDVGACVIRVGLKDVGFCDHVVSRYDLLRPCGQIPNARSDGTEHLYHVRGRRAHKMEVVKERQAA